MVEEEQHGKKRAEYGMEVLKALSTELQVEFGKGFGERNLRNFRQRLCLCIPAAAYTHGNKVYALSAY